MRQILHEPDEATAVHPPRHQVVPETATEKFLETRRADQERALKLLNADPGLSELQVMLAPLFDLEVRGVPALRYFGDQIWK